MADKIKVKDLTIDEKYAVIINWCIQNDVYSSDDVKSGYKDKINDKSKEKDKL
jgi:hypothetical protein